MSEKIYRRLCGMTEPMSMDDAKELLDGIKMKSLGHVEDDVYIPDRLIDSDCSSRF